MTLHQTHRAKRDARVKTHPARVADDELGAAAADVDHERRRLGQARTAHDAGEHEPRLVVAAEHVHRLAKRVEQLSRVARVAYGAGGDDSRVAAVVRLGQGEQLVHRGDGGLDRFGLEFAAGVEAAAKSGLAAGFEMRRNLVAAQVGDKQFHRVGADVDDAAPHGMLKCGRGRGWRHR